jgi:DNA-binding HxlR family transcriptional regulator
VEYSLSELGESMRPILESMQSWGNNYKQLMATASEQ